MAPKRALVVGSGLGALASAAMLERAGWQVVVRAQEYAALAFDDALGIWSPALAALRAWLGASRCDALASAGRFVGAVDGYHDGRGRQLCGPATDLGEGTGERPALLFLPRSALLRELRGACGAGVRFDARAGSGVTAAELRSELEGSWHMIVGADGSDSTVRSTLVPRGAVPTALGFHVYRGVATAPLAAGADASEPLLPRGRSFQAWSTSATRFAAVPTTSPACAAHAPPLDAAAWFATSRGPPPAAGDVRAAVRALAAAHFAPYAAALVDATQDAHLAPPIAARAHSPGLLRGAHGRIARAAPGGAGGGGGGGDGSDGAAVALVGDAAWTLDPILAQGGGVAIEDAAELAACTAAWAPAHGAGALDAALRAYEAARRPRLRALAAISLLPDALGQMAGLPASLRDGLLAALPRTLSSAAFEVAMHASLAPAPLAGRWRYDPPQPPPRGAPAGR
ncbi:hypothetical protein KFE25_011144 [Diacronema lutheri]|uniref:FAD-binding domain-containing protein n=1 Tax=Diacronema lutheri TaxID=2081491 RepID=A0A8J6C619_DIALT|nr:hypothetical protein KFE25_011144 [Diacronema lutheri]